MIHKAIPFLIGGGILLPALYNAIDIGAKFPGWANIPVVILQFVCVVIGAIIVVKGKIKEKNNKK